MPVEFRVSKDARLLNQYYALRQRCFRNELGLPDFDGSEDDDDRQSRILLALCDGECVGGARVSTQVPWASQAEALDIPRDGCCMWERLGFDPRVRSPQLLRAFCGALIEVSRDAGFGHAMVLSSLRNARFYRRCHTALGVQFEIHRPVPHCARGAFAGLEHYLSVAYLQESAPLEMVG